MAPCRTRPREFQATGLEFGQTFGGATEKMRTKMDDLFARDRNMQIWLHYIYICIYIYILYIYVFGKMFLAGSIICITLRSSLPAALSSGYGCMGGASLEPYGSRSQRLRHKKRTGLWGHEFPMVISDIVMIFISKPCLCFLFYALCLKLLSKWWYLAGVPQHCSCCCSTSKWTKHRRRLLFQAWFLRIWTENLPWKIARNNENEARRETT